MSKNVYVVGIGGGIVFTVWSKFSMRKWLTNFTDLGYTVTVRKLSDQEIECLTSKK